jgi:hypothetical protein
MKVLLMEMLVPTKIKQKVQQAHIAAGLCTPRDAPRPVATGRGGYTSPLALTPKSMGYHTSPMARTPQAGDYGTPPKPSTDRLLPGSSGPRFGSHYRR